MVATIDDHPFYRCETEAARLESCPGPWGQWEEELGFMLGLCASLGAEAPPLGQQGSGIPRRFLPCAHCWVGGVEATEQNMLLTKTQMWTEGSHGVRGEPVIVSSQEKQSPVLNK